MPLNVRTLGCPECKITHDWDHNAAINILAAGRAERLDACGDYVRPHLGMAGSMK
uniref:transposase n=1 Tax=Saccharopolyspora pogona TaxID=333966 RepID=UPI001CC25A74|nr:transposase [Saccharopolyspora pogona]